MLQKISDRIHGWIAGVIIAIIAAVFGLWGIEYYIDRGPNGSETIATVNGQKITQKQFNTLYRQLQQRIAAAQPSKALSIAQQKQVKSLALQQLVTKTALVQAATKAGFGVNLQEVQQLILQAPEFQVKGLFSPQRFQQFLLSIQSTEKQFLVKIQRNFIMNQVSIGLVSSAFVLPNELQRAYQLIYQKRSFGYFVLPLSKFLSGVKLTDKEVKAYYEKNKQGYKTPGKVQVSYLLLTPQSVEKTIKIPTAELKAYYSANKLAYSTPRSWKILRIKVPVSDGATAKEISKAEQRIQKIQLQLKSGQSFKSLMKGQGLKSSTLTLTPTTTKATTANVLAMLSKGQVSEPYHSATGINLIKLITVNPETVTPFVKVKASIEKRLVQQKALQILSQQSDTLSNLTYTNPSTLKIAADKMTLSIQTSPWFTKQGVKKGLFANHAVVNIAFSDTVLQDGNNSNPIDLSDGSIMVLRVNKHQPSRVQSLAEVKSIIEKVLRKNKAESKAGLLAYEVSSALASGTSPQALATHYGVKWVAKNSVKRNDKSVLSPILISAFSTVPAKGKSDSGTHTLVMANGNYIVLRVSTVQLADPSTAQTKQLDALKKEISKMNGDVEYRLYGKSVLSRAKIKIHNKKS